MFSKSDAFLEGDIVYKVLYLSYAGGQSKL